MLVKSMLNRNIIPSLEMDWNLYPMHIVPANFNQVEVEELLDLSSESMDSDQFDDVDEGIDG